MIVLGAAMHNRSHTVAAIAATTGEALGDKTIQVGEAGFIALLDWARGFGDDRAWALEDCRHVSSSFERFLLSSGERVVRVATKLMSEARRAGRDRGKSDRIDALAVARAALREGLDGLPSAQLAGVELDIRLLVDHRERLIPQPRRAQQRLALAPARPLARSQAADQRPVLEEGVDADRAPPGARRADRPRPDCPRRAAAPARTHRRC